MGGFVKLPRGTSGAFDALATGGGLVPFQPYYLTDLEQVRIAKSTTDWVAIAKEDVATLTTAGLMSAGDKGKLSNIEADATKNATDADLRDRATHTGEQAIATITGLQTALDGKLTADGLVLGLAGFCSPAPKASQRVGGHIAPWAGDLDQAASFAKSAVAAAATTTFTIKREGANVGAIVFNAAATTGTVSFSSTPIAVGDLITVHAPATADANLAGIAYKLGVVPA